MRTIETIGGAAQGPEDGRSDRVAGVSAAGHRVGPAEALGTASLGTTSLAGAAGRSERPEAMLARGSRVTGSGGAAMASRSAVPPGQPSGDLVFALPHGGSVAFAALADFSADRFL